MTAKKRSDERHGHRTKAEQSQTSKVSTHVKPIVPHADPGWSKMAQEMYKALKRSPQSVYYTDADWQYAKWTMFVMTDTQDNPTAMKVATVDGMLSKLLVDEPSRRKANIEIQQPDEDEIPEGQLIILEDYDRDLA